MSQPFTTIRYGANHSGATTTFGGQQAHVHLPRAEPPVHSRKDTPERRYQREEAYRKTRQRINAEITRHSEHIAILHGIRGGEAR